MQNALQDVITFLKEDLYNFLLVNFCMFTYLEPFRFQSIQRKISISLFLNNAYDLAADFK